MEMIDVFDVVRLMKLYAHEINQAGVFNITSGEAVTQADFLKTLKKVFEVDVVDSTKLFPKGLEKEAIEAFTSNIRLTSLHPEIMEKFRFTSLAETVKRIKTEVESA
jgi:NAD dependent epimerase/dehydratase family enzyme